MVEGVLEESAAIVSTQLLANSTMPNGSALAMRVPGINVIVKSPTLESLTSRSFDNETSEVSKTPDVVKAPQPKPKRRFVFTDSKDSEEEKAEPSPKDKKIDRKFERLSSELGDEVNVQQFEETFAEIKDDASELQNEFSKMSFGDSTNSGDTPDNDLQGELEERLSF